MASPLTTRALQTIGDSGFARAKKLADLAIKTNTDSSGSATARGYEQALTYLQPFTDSAKGNEAIDAQRLIAGYGNTLDKLSKKQRDQNETVSAFKLQEMDSYFTSFDGDTGGFRSPESLIGSTSEALDSLVLGVINAIDEKTASGDSTDALYAYMNDLNKRANTMRDLRNKFDNGELTGKSLDGFGYYVDTNPLDGSVRSAALIPVGLAPDGMTAGFHRLEATTKVGGALLPVYAPAQQDSQGGYIAKIGDATWTGTGTGALQGDGKTSNSKEGEFSISDGSIFPVRKNAIDRGSFGKGFIGRDASGNPVETVFYRGADNKLYSVDQATVDQFKKDPLLAKKLDGYVPQFSPTEMQALSKEAVPLSGDRIAREGKIAGFQTQDAALRAEADRVQNRGFFSKLFNPRDETATTPAATPEATPTPTPPSFFQKKNEPTPPAEPTVSGSANDLIDQGKGFFRSVGNWINKK